MPTKKTTTPAPAKKNRRTRARVPSSSGTGWPELIPSNKDVVVLRDDYRPTKAEIADGDT